MQIGTPLTNSATRVLLLGSGELGKEVAIELQRLGCEVIACDRYANAPAMQVAHRSHVFSMLDAPALRSVVELERPHVIVPEIEAIATATLLELEAEGFRVIPTARAADLTMNREGIRSFAAVELGLATSPYRFVESVDALVAAVDDLRSTGRGQAGHVLEWQGSKHRPRPSTRSRTHGTTPAARAVATRPAASSKVSSRSTTRSRC